MSEATLTDERRSEIEQELGSALRVPPGVELLDFVGAGKRSMTFRARLNREVVALKVYRKRFIDKYRDRYGLNIARYEFERNSAFYAVNALRPYSARPLAVFDDPAVSSLCFGQEFLDLPSLKEAALAEGRVPPEVLEAGRAIVAAASEAGLYDLDISTKNIKVRRSDAGWMPVVYDFNLVPQYRYPPNPLIALAYWCGLRHKAHRDHRAVRNWATLKKA
jgi:hypothetical protein